jgi:hypothetical protein
MPSGRYSLPPKVTPAFTPPSAPANPQGVQNNPPRAGRARRTAASSVGPRTNLLHEMAAVGSAARSASPTLAEKGQPAGGGALASPVQACIFISGTPEPSEGDCSSPLSILSDNDPRLMELDDEEERAAGRAASPQAPLEQAAEAIGNEGMLVDLPEALPPAADSVETSAVFSGAPSRAPAPNRALPRELQMRRTPPSHKPPIGDTAPSSKDAGNYAKEPLPGASGLDSGYNMQPSGGPLLPASTERVELSRYFLSPEEGMAEFTLRPNQGKSTSTPGTPLPNLQTLSLLPRQAPQPAAQPTPRASLPPLARLNLPGTFEASAIRESIKRLLPLAGTIMSQSQAFGVLRAACRKTVNFNIGVHHGVPGCNIWHEDQKNHEIYIDPYCRLPLNHSLQERDLIGEVLFEAAYQYAELAVQEKQLSREQLRAAVKTGEMEAFSRDAVRFTPYSIGLVRNGCNPAEVYYAQSQLVLTYKTYVEARPALEELLNKEYVREEKVRQALNIASYPLENYLQISSEQFNSFMVEYRNLLHSSGS